MHALLVTVSIDPAGVEEAQENLRSRVVPAVKQAPGLVAAYWLDPKPGPTGLEGFSVALFDTEENAKKAQEMAENSPVPDSVKFTGFEIRGSWSAHSALGVPVQPSAAGQRHSVTFASGRRDRGNIVARCRQHCTYMGAMAP